MRTWKRFPASFNVEEFSEISRRLAELREPAMYGDEIRMIAALKLFDETQANEVVADAEKVHEACASLVGKLRKPKAVDRRTRLR